MRKLIAIGFILCILLTVLVSGASAARVKDKAAQSTVSISNYAYATASSVDKPAFSAVTAYSGVSITKKEINAVCVTQASASGDYASVNSGQTLSAYFSR